VGALVDQELRRIVLENGEVAKEEIMFGEVGARIRDVRANSQGHLYILTDSKQGKIIRVVPNK